MWVEGDVAEMRLEPVVGSLGGLVCSIMRAELILDILETISKFPGKGVC